VQGKSFKKNVNQHEFILKELIDFYEENKGTLTKGQKTFICNRIANSAGMHLYILLSFENSKVNKLKIKEFINYIKKASSDIFAKLKKEKRYKLLVYSNFILYPLLVKHIGKKNKL